MDAFPDAGNYLAWPDGPGNPVGYAAGFQLAGSFAGMVRWPARGCLGFPGLQPAGNAPGLVGLDNVGFHPGWQRLAALAIGLILFFTGDRLVAYEFILGSMTLWMVVELVKALVRRSRPIFRVTQARLSACGRLGDLSQRAYQPGFLHGDIVGPIFPCQRLGGVFAVCLALLVGITRMYVGAHYPRDVLAGAILGSAWGLLGVLVNGYVLNGVR